MSPTTLATSHAILAAIATSPNLAEISQKNYQSSLRLLTQNISRQTDCWAAITDHKFSIAALLAKFEGRPASLNSYAAAVLTCFKLDPSLKTMAPSAYAAWCEVHAEARKPLEARVLTSQPSSRQAPGWIPFERLVAMRKSLPVGSPERLLLALYLDIPAARNDYSHLGVYSKRSLVKTANFILLPPSADLPVTLTVRSYKTQKVYGDITQTLPATLVEDIRAGMLKYPRENLFVSPQTCRPYKSPTVFGHWANQTLKRLFGCPLSLTILRHIYVSHLKFDSMTGQERADIARLMMHSVTAQGAYKWIKS